MPYEMAEDRYDGTTGEGAEQNALSANKERTGKDKAEDPIAGKERKVWQFQAPQPETPDIGESNPGGVWAIRRKTATYREEPLTMHKSMKSRNALISIRGRNGEEPSKSIPETSVFGLVHPRETEEKDDGAEESWHDANEEGCEMACEMVDKGTRERPGQGPSPATLRAGWDVIRSWFVGPRPESA